MATSDHADRSADDGELSNRINRCPECDGHVVNGGGETTCRNCGLVLEEDQIDTGPEWWPNQTHDSRERTGAPLTSTRHDRGLSTEIGLWTDANGTLLSGRKRRQMDRLRREHSRGKWRSKAERNLAHGLAETRRISSVLELPRSIQEQACVLFRRASKRDLLRGRSIEAIAAASVHAACRCNGLPRSIHELIDVGTIDRSAVENAYRVLNRELGIQAAPPEPRKYVVRIASELELSDGTRLRAEDLAKRAVEEGIGIGCHPAGLAAGCIYAIAQSRCERATQKDLASCAGVTPTTVRARCEELRPLLGEIDSS